MATFKLGWKKDPVDLKDHDAVRMLAHVGTPPASWSNADLVQILDQGGLGSCTMNATAQAVRAAELVEQMTAGKTLLEAKTLTPFMSRLFGYYLARAYEGTSHEDAGTYIRLCFQTINKYGFPPESAWPYSDDSDPLTGAFAKMPPAEAFREAYDQRDSVANENDNLISYARISATGNARILAIKAACANRNLVVFGTDVSEDFCASVGIGSPIAPPVNLKIAGGHAMCVAGYEGDNFLVPNSWGVGYGDKGFVKFTAEYMAWAQTDDLWIVKRAPLLLKAA